MPIHLRASCLQPISTKLQQNNCAYLNMEEKQPASEERWERIHFCRMILKFLKKPLLSLLLSLMTSCLSKSTFVPLRSHIFPLTARRLDVLLNRWTELWPLAYVLTVPSEPEETVMTSCDKSLWFGWNNFTVKCWAMTWHHKLLLQIACGLHPHFADDEMKAPVRNSSRKQSHAEEAFKAVWHT